MPMPTARVLVVDDDEDDFVLASSLLSRTRQPIYEVEWAPTFDRGLVRLRDEPFDACLVDVPPSKHRTHGSCQTR